MRERWSRKAGGFVVVPEVDAFLAEIVEVCKRHGLSIQHEDSGGAFQVVEFYEPAMEWLLDADDVRA